LLKTYSVLKRGILTMLTIMFLACACVNTWAFDTNNLRIIHTSPSALRAAGIAAQNPGNIGVLDIPCKEVPNGWGVTISKKLYNLYRKRGFSRAAVCLGLGGRGVYFDPATGRQLPLYEPFRFTGDASAPLWLSDCYRKVKIIRVFEQYLVYWRPTGCVLRYNPSTGEPVSNPNHVELVAGGEAGSGTDEDNGGSTISDDRLRNLVEGR
jgi:hypothetical protein